MNSSDNQDVAALQQRIADLEATLDRVQQENVSLRAELARAEAMDMAQLGQIAVIFETFDADALIVTVAEAVQPLMNKKRNAFSVQRETALGEMHTDRAKLRQILFNLLSYAAKLTEDGTVTLTTARAQGEDGDVAIFSVADTGIGMRHEQMAKLFVPQMTQHGGAGLAIPHYFCELLGGTLAVASELGQGSVFTVRLPVRAPARATTTPALPASVKPRKTASPPEAVSEEEATVVLVIDDDPAAQELITHFLNKEGFHTVTASSGSEGLRMAHDLHPDVITLDVMMPEMDGWVVLSDIKSDPKLMDIPVVILTILDKKQMGFALGASDYLTKPIDREHLLRTLRRYERESTTKALKEAYVLVVEDDDSARRMLRRTLQLAAWKVMEAADGYEALEKVAEQEPALILLDLMMPKMDGFTFISELRKNPAWRDIPIVVITAKDLDRDERERLKGTVEQILQKGGYRRDELLREVRDHIFTQMHYRAV